MSDINIEAKFIRDMVNGSMYYTSQHAIDRMNERNMTCEELEDIILNHSYRLAKLQGNNTRYDFYTTTNDKIIVALGEEATFPVIVTVIKGGE